MGSEGVAFTISLFFLDVGNMSRWLARNRLGGLAKGITRVEAQYYTVLVASIHAFDFTTASTGTGISRTSVRYSTSGALFRRILISEDLCSTYFGKSRSRKLLWCGVL